MRDADYREHNNGNGSRDAAQYHEARHPLSPQKPACGGVGHIGAMGTALRTVGASTKEQLATVLAPTVRADTKRQMFVVQ